MSESRVILGCLILIVCCIMGSLFAVSISDAWGDETPRYDCINFGPRSPTDPPWCGVDRGSGFDADLRYGWAIGPGDRMPQRRRDVERGSRDTFVSTSGIATWDHVVDDGCYAVTVTSGDAEYSSGPHVVDVEGVRLIDGERTVARQWIQRQGYVLVSDGTLTLRIGGDDRGFTVINSLQFVPVPIERCQSVQQQLYFWCGHNRLGRETLMVPSIGHDCGVAVLNLCAICGELECCDAD